MTTATRSYGLADLRFWTRADQSECDLLVFELVRAHERGVRGKHLEQLIGLVVDWRDRRLMRSRAAWLRERQDERDAESFDVDALRDLAGVG
jgi:hypothetical protein